jgi:hypothetical protein
MNSELRDRAAGASKTAALSAAHDDGSQGFAPTRQRNIDTRKDPTFGQAWQEDPLADAIASIQSVAFEARPHGPTRLPLVENDFETYLRQDDRIRSSDPGVHEPEEAKAVMSISREEIDAKDRLLEEKILSSEQRIENSILKVVSDFRESAIQTNAHLHIIEAKLSGLPSTRTMIWSIFGSGIAVAALLTSVAGGMLAFGGDRFDAGIGLGQDISRQSQQIEILAQRVEALVEGLGRTGRLPQSPPAQNQ